MGNTITENKLVESRDGHIDHGDWSHEDLVKLQLEKRSKVRWTYFATIMLGFWLLMNALTYDPQSYALKVNDLTCGALVVVLGALAISSRLDWLRWLISTIGVWLLFSPIAFWAPTAQVFDSDMLIGTMIIAFSFLIPGMPRSASLKPRGKDVPPGWSYNPSAWEQRGPLIALALIGFFAARYMGAYQLGYIDTVWDPFFGDGTKNILTSDVSHSFPVADAALGAFSYIIDALAGFAGDKARWRTMPWMVILFGILILPPGITSITLVILQPVAVGSWCSICLFASVVMLIMVPFAFDEIAASAQFLYTSYKEGKPFWRTFWMGADLEPTQIDELQKEEEMSFWGLIGGEGVSLSWNLVASTLIGTWLMFSPTILGLTGLPANLTYFCSALIITFAVSATADVSRPIRFLNIPIGVLMLIAPFVIQGFTTDATIHSIVVALSVMALAIPNPALKDTYGSYEKLIF